MWAPSKSPITLKSSENSTYIFLCFVRAEFVWMFWGCFVFKLTVKLGQKEPGGWNDLKNTEHSLFSHLALVGNLKMGTELPPRGSQVSVSQTTWQGAQMTHGPRMSMCELGVLKRSTKLRCCYYYFLFNNFYQKPDCLWYKYNVIFCVQFYSMTLKKLYVWSPCVFFITQINFLLSHLSPVFKEKIFG